MGCIQAPSGQIEAPQQPRGLRPKVILGEGAAQQGVRELKKNYLINSQTQVLGVGAFGKVFKTHNIYDPNLKVAIKVMNKLKLDDKLNCIMDEVQTLNTLDHPNIVKYFETYNDQKYIYLVMEYIEGQALFDKICQQENQIFTEHLAARYMKSLFQAINHCHAQNVVHRDIKPENIMITACDTVRLIDFGLAKASTGPKSIDEIAGTPYYMAPEVLGSHYGSQSDLWSLGVVLYTLVSGYLPFQGNSQLEVFTKIRNVDYHFNHPEFKNISAECKDLVSKLLCGKPKDRITGQKALQHPWFKKFAESNSGSAPEGTTTNIEVLQRLQSFKGVSTFKKAAMNLLVKTATEEEVKDLRAQF